MQSPLQFVRNLLYEIWYLIRATISGWIEDNIPTDGAALAFYTIFSIAPLIIILIAITGFLFGEAATTGQLEEYMTQLMGAELARTLENFVISAYEPASGIIATVLSLGVILFTATTIITQLKETLNKIWNVTSKAEVSGFKRFLINRVLALALILIFASLFALSMLMEFALKGLETLLDPVIPGGVGIWSNLNFLFTFAVLVLLCTIVFKLLPDVQVRWRDVLVGSVVTTLLILFGRYLIGMYMGMATATTYSAAGSFVVFLIWVYYNSMVFFLGAEFTKAYAFRFGSRIKPADHAEFTTDPWSEA